MSKINQKCLKHMDSLHTKHGSDCHLHVRCRFSSQTWNRPTTGTFILPAACLSQPLRLVHSMRGLEAPLTGLSIHTDSLLHWLCSHSLHFLLVGSKEEQLLHQLPISSKYFAQKQRKHGWNFLEMKVFVSNKNTTWNTIEILLICVSLSPYHSIVRF